jgi:ribosomal protein S3
MVVKPCCYPTTKRGRKGHPLNTLCAHYVKHVRRNPVLLTITRIKRLTIDPSVIAVPLAQHPELHCGVD